MECILEMKFLYVSVEYVVILKVEFIEVIYDFVSNLEVLGNNNIVFWFKFGCGLWFFFFFGEDYYCSGI